MLSGECWATELTYCRQCCRHGGAEDSTSRAIYLIRTVDFGVHIALLGFVKKAPQHK